MAIPTAVSPSVLTPGLYLIVNLLAGEASPGTGVLRVALMATQSAAGDLTDDTEVRAGGGIDSARTAFGPGTVGALAAELIYDEYNPAQIDFISPVAGATAAVLVLTAAGAPSSNQIADFDIAGRTFEVTWLVGETFTNFSDKISAAITARTNELPCSAANVAGATTITGKVTGNISNDILVKAKLRYAQSGTETFTGAVTHTALAGGTTDPTFANALAAIAGQEYHIIVPCLSNTDVDNTATANNLSLVVGHINTYNSGLGAKLQQVVCGFTGAIADAKTTALNANGAGNDEAAELIDCVNGRGLPGELAAREAGGRIAGESLDPAVNRIGELLDGYIGSHDIIADRPTAAESEDALGNGVSLVTYNSSDAEQLVRAITCHHQDSAGGADRRLLDVQNVSGAYIVARDIRDNLPLAFPNAKIVADVAEGAEPPPEGVIEERDIKAWVVSRLRGWVRSAVVNGASLDTAVSSGTLIVQVNSGDATQVDIVMPYEIIQPLAKFGVVAQRIPS